MDNMFKVFLLIALERGIKSLAVGIPWWKTGFGSGEGLSFLMTVS